MKAYMILDLQYGSTGKGLLAGMLAEKNKPDTIVTAWGPNAGHTYVDANGRRYIHRMLGNGIVSPMLENVLIGPGSVVDLDSLLRELRSCADLMRDKTLIIHPRAVIVTDKHCNTEKRNVKIGSTMKGTGAAVIERIERNPDNNPTAAGIIHDEHEFRKAVEDLDIHLFIDDHLYSSRLSNSRVLQIEGAQGFSLSMYHGFYPYTTSRDVTPAQVMADCAIPWKIRPEVYGTLRTYPIRVANRYDDDGNMIGTSGPCHSDQQELEWSDIGMEPELTTVTKLPRRIFTFSEEQLVKAVEICGPDKLFLNFCNYLTFDRLESLLLVINHTVRKCRGAPELKWLGFGPTVSDVYEYHPDVLDQYDSMLREPYA